LPLERFETKRTGSIASRVGPAVISTVRPSSAPSTRAGSVARGAGASPSSARAMSTGSSMRPWPVSPSASAPAAGPSTRTPRAVSVATFACVAGFFHIAQFIAGATAIGAVVARQSVANRSSARPWASRARKSALAGATSTSSAQRASSR
jgi:hypothetical protein